MPGTVVVGCRLPYGVVLRGFVMEDVTREVMGGVSKVFKEARDTGISATVLGYRSVAPDSGNAPLIVNGAAITYGVDADLWKQWALANVEMVKHNVVFAFDKHDATISHARDVVKERTGIEPLDPEKLPAEFSRV